MKTSKTVIVTNQVFGNLLCLIGYITSIFFIIMIIASIAIKSGIAFTLILLIILFPCIICIIKGTQIKKICTRYKNYISLISLQHMTKIGDIANATSQSVDYVRNDLQKMINKNFFTNAYVDVKTSEIIIVSHEASMNHQNISTETETITCSGCGAKTVKQNNKATKCEYCGLHI